MLIVSVLGVVGIITTSVLANSFLEAEILDGSISSIVSKIAAQEEEGEENDEEEQLDLALPFTWSFTCGDPSSTGGSGSASELAEFEEISDSQLLPETGPGSRDAFQSLADSAICGLPEVAVDAQLPGGGGAVTTGCMIWAVEACGPLGVREFCGVDVSELDPSLTSGIQDGSYCTSNPYADRVEYLEEITDSLREVIDSGIVDFPNQGEVVEIPEVASGSDGESVPDSVDVPVRDWTSADQIRIDAPAACPVRASSGGNTGGGFFLNQFRDGIISGTRFSHSIPRVRCQNATDIHPFSEYVETSEVVAVVGGTVNQIVMPDALTRSGLTCNVSPGRYVGGLALTIRDRHNNIHSYMHLDADILARFVPGDEIQAGEVIGRLYAGRFNFEGVDASNPKVTENLTRAQEINSLADLDFYSRNGSESNSCFNSVHLHYSVLSPNIVNQNYPRGNILNSNRYLRDACPAATIRSGVDTPVGEVFLPQSEITLDCDEFPNPVSAQDYNGNVVNYEATGNNIAMLSNTIAEISAQENTATEVGADDANIEVNNSGDYVFDIDGHIVEKTLILDGNSGVIRLFRDQNFNGVRDSGEEFLARDQVQFDVSTESQVLEYNLNAGWNLIHVPLLPESGDTWTASEIAAELGRSSLAIDQVARYTDSAFEIYVDRGGVETTSADFQFFPGEGVFVFVSFGAGPAIVRGQLIESSLEQNLRNGYNLVGFTGNSTKGVDLGSAVSYLESGEAQEVGIDSISQYENGLYQSAIRDGGVVFSSIDFPLLPTRGYFVRVSGDSVTGGGS